MKRIINGFCLFIVITAFLSCTEEPKKTPPPEKDSKKEKVGTLTDKERLDRTKKIYSHIPSPLETSIILKEAGIVYNRDILTDPEKVHNYQSSLARALNLGIYGADLSFASAYGEESDLFSYYVAVQALADQMNISSAFGEDKFRDIEVNLTNHEMLMQLVSESYWSANSELAEHERAGISALMISGGWLEAMYIAVTLTNNDFSKSTIVEKIGEQKQALEYLMQLLEDVHKDPQVAKIIDDFKSLNALYVNLEYTGEIEEIHDPVTGEVKRTLKKVVLPEKVLQKITQKVKDMRAHYVGLV